jgi:hypothetical protein
MGAWSLGRDVAKFDAKAIDGETPSLATVAAVKEAESTVKDFAGKVLQWIPGEVIAFYGAITTIIVQNDKDSIGDLGTVLLTGAGVLFAAGFVVLAAFSNTSKSGWLTKQVKLRSALAAVAFAIWSLTIPSSGWNQINWIAENPAPTAAIAGFLGLVFSMFATGADKHWGGESA